jgi:hypothetical protein
MNTNDLQAIAYSFPTPQYPFYHLKLAVRTAQDCTVKRVLTNGQRTRDFWIYNNGQFNRHMQILTEAESTIAVRLEWENGSSNRVEIEAETEGGEQIVLAESFTAPSSNGYWNPAWKYYASVVLSEPEGLARTNEPVHITLGLYADRLTAPEKEVRVVAIDPESGVSSEVPCQVYAVSTWDEFADEHCQPTTTVELAFLADVPALSSRVYLVFYGNPQAEAPVYPSDLVISGEGLGLTVENSCYRTQLHPLSGAIDEVHLKMGVNVTFDHHLETNGALHWNPGVYAPPRTWIHASDWDPPEGYTSFGGPIFFTTKRWGPLPLYPEVQVSITYIFYAHQPYVIMTSSMDVLKDLDVVALRNGEIVLNHNVIREFAWKKPDGEIGSVVIKEQPRHPTRGLIIEADAPWLAFYNRDLACAFAGINLELTHMRRQTGLSRVEQPYIYMHWGPWAYAARPLIYTFATPNPQRVIRAPGGSTYYEKMAFLPTRLGATDRDRFTPIDQRQRMLTNPLDVFTDLDIDERVPEEWVPPILVEEFEEMEDD